MKKRRILKFLNIYFNSPKNNFFSTEERLNPKWKMKNAVYAKKCFNRVKYLLIDEKWSFKKVDLI